MLDKNGEEVIITPQVDATSPEQLLKAKNDDEYINSFVESSYTE